MTDLPTGTVTFLFTDIEGSTRRWQADPDMAESLRRHDDILRVATKDHRGHWVKHTGDGTLAVFVSASDGVAAAVQAQRALAAEDWGAEPLRARMSVHVGEAEERDGDYFGLAVSLGARIMAAAHGGQILASDPVQALASGGEVEFRDLGEHQLPGITGVRRIFQVVAEGLRFEFPPLRVAGGARVNLPRPRTSFIGRKRALGQIDSLLDEAFLVTLTGAGGCGKTRLAIEVARRGAERFPEGVFFADLSSLAEPTHIARRLADGVGIHPADGFAPASTRPLEDDLIAYFRTRRCLVLLDNCEHLLDACAELVDRFLDECPDLRVLATSREALGVEGERAWRVPSLSLPDAGGDAEGSEAVDLLADRARIVRPELNADVHRPALAEISRRLDGMPLALELAAGRMAYMSPAEIASRLDERFLLAGGGRRGERQQTLEAAIDWSHDLLDDDERKLFRQLSVFAGGFSFDAAAGVCGEGLEPPTADVVGSLVNKSLVVADDTGAETRYRLLETIRIYAQRKLADAGETEEIRRRHRDWFLGWVESLPIDQRTYSSVVIARMVQDLDNLRAALAWSRGEDRPDLVARMVNGMFGVFWLSGHIKEGWDWATFAHSADLEPEIRRSLEVMMRTLSTLGLFEDPEQVRAFYAERQHEFEALPDDDPIAAVAMMTKVIFHLGIGFDVDAAAHAADEAVRRARATQLPLMLAGAAVAQAWVRLTRGEAEQALDVVTEAMSSPEWSDEHDGVQLRMTHATAAQVVGEHEAVIVDADVMERSFGGEGSPIPSSGWSYLPPLYRALGLAGRGDIDGARSAMREAVERVRSSPRELPLAIADCVVGCAACAYHLGERERASELLATIRQGAAGFWVRTPASFAVYLHYRNRLRDELDRDVRRRCIEKGQATSLDAAVDAELARWNAEMYP